MKKITNVETVDYLRFLDGPIFDPNINT